MSVSGSASSGSTAAIEVPDLCRVTILTRQTRVDLALPANVPLALLIPGITELVGDHLRRGRVGAATGGSPSGDSASHDSTSHDSTADDHNTADEFVDDRRRPREWVLTRIGQPPLSPTASLAEQDIRDGELLTLTTVARAAPLPLFDDIMDAVATTAAARSRRWVPDTARVLGTMTALLAISVGGIALVRAAGSATDLIGASCAAVTALVLLIAGVVASRVYAAARAARDLCACALPAVATTGALLVPGPLGAADLLLAAAATGATAAISIRATGTGQAVLGAVATVAGYLVVGAAVALFTPVPDHAVAAGAVAVGLVGLGSAPRVALLLGRLPLPRVPAPGAPVESDDPADRAAQPGYLADSTERAEQYLTGLIAGTSIAVTAAALLAAPAEAPTWPGLALAGAVAAVLAFRGRTYVEAAPAGWLIASGAAIGLGLLLGAALSHRAPQLCYFAAAGFAVTALALSLLGPLAEPSPPLRRGIDLLEYAAITAVVPLTCWVAGLFGLIRGL